MIKNYEFIWKIKDRGLVYLGLDFVHRTSVGINMWNAGVETSTEKFIEIETIWIFISCNLYYTRRDVVGF